MSTARRAMARTAAPLAVLALLAGGSAAAQEASPSPSPEAEPVPISEDTSAPKEPLPVRDSTFALGQSMQIRVNADAQPNSNLANFRWTVSQLTVQGPPDGSQDGDYTVPVPEDGAMTRYLDQFGRPQISDGIAQFDVQVRNGTGLQRTVSLFPDDREPPVALLASFTLDGEPITAADLVGKSGVVTAHYTLVNNSAAPTEVTVDNLAGEPVARTVEADVPMIGIAKTLLPQRYTGLNTGSGQFGADGRGNNQVQWVALPFKPLSKDGTATFGWSANVTDAVIPSMLIQVAPLYLPAHEDDPSTPNIDEGRVAGLPVNLDPAMAEIQAGLAQVVAGVETLTEGGGEDPLQAIEDRLNEFFAQFGTNLVQVADNLQPTIDGLAEVVPLLQSLQGGLAGVNENWDQLMNLMNLVAQTPSQVLWAAIKELPAGGACDQNGDGRWDAGANPVTGPFPETGCLRDVAATVYANGDFLSGQLTVILPLIDTLIPVSQLLLDGLVGLQNNLRLIVGGLPTAELPTLDAVISNVVAGVLSSPGGQQITGGLAQVEGGIGLAKAELSAFLADVIVRVQNASAVADESIVALKASVAGLKSAASRSPLVYGPLPEDLPPGTVLAGAYEFRVDAADTNLPYTPWRILGGVLLLAVAGLLGWRLMSARTAASGAEPESEPVAGGPATAAMPALDDSGPTPGRSGPGA